MVQGSQWPRLLTRAALCAAFIPSVTSWSPITPVAPLFTTVFQPKAGKKKKVEASCTSAL